jgi:urease accessory protein
LDKEVCIGGRSGRYKALEMIAKLHIETALRNGKTYLKQAYHTTPFKVANITEDKREGKLELMIMSSSPGILDGDEYDIKIDVAEGCSLELHTQSFQRLFHMQKGAKQNVEVAMGKGASFCYMPHPTVPHHSSSFISKSKIYVLEGCELIWGEVLTCGRKLSGEEFEFSRYHNITEIFLDKRLVVKENLLMQPSKVDLKAIGQLEGYTHQASLIYINETKNILTTITEVHERLSTIEGISFGVSALQINGLIVRLLGYKGDQLHSILKQITSMLQAKTTEVINEQTEEVYAS